MLTEAEISDPHSFAERDILLRYHWGMGVGHTHAHGLSKGIDVQPIKISSIQYDEAEEEGGDRGDSQPEKAHVLEEMTSTRGGLADEPMLQLGTWYASLAMIEY